MLAVIGSHQHTGVRNAGTRSRSNASAVLAVFTPAAVTHRSSSEVTGKVTEPFTGRGAARRSLVVVRCPLRGLWNLASILVTSPGPQVQRIYSGVPSHHAVSPNRSPKAMRPNDSGRSLLNEEPM